MTIGRVVAELLGVALLGAAVMYGGTWLLVAVVAHIERQRAVHARFSTLARYAVGPCRGGLMLLPAEHGAWVRYIDVLACLDTSDRPAFMPTTPQNGSKVDPAQN